MYLDFYHLKKEPFHITPDPEFLYLSPSHKEALAAIIYGIEQKKGFVAIFGAVGVGKTTVLRSYLERADKKNLKIIYIFNARLTFEEILKTIYQDLDLDLNTNETMAMVDILYHCLIDEYQKGNNVVLVIDEAQNMPVETLENLRMLSNLETSKDKLIQIVMVGQPEFEEELNLDRLRQLKQRIAIRATILPLTKEESLSYVNHRLVRAGTSPSTIFNKAALDKIIKKADGIPRVINILCDNVLITGYGYQQKPVGPKIVQEVIADMDGKKKQSRLKWRLTYGLSAVALMIGTYLAFHFGTFPSFNLNALWLIEKSNVTPTPRQPPPTKSLPKVIAPSQNERSAKLPEERPAPVTQHPVSTKEAMKITVSSPPVSAREVQNEPASPAASSGSLPTPSVEPQATITEPVPRPVKRVRTSRKPSKEDLSRSESALTTAILEKKSQIVDPNLISSGSRIVMPPAASQLKSD